MKKKLIYLSLVFLVLWLLAGCSTERTIEGAWQDASGYRIEFMSDGTFMESTYGKPMQYTVTEDNLLYAWADGFMRSTPIVFESDGLLSLTINGEARTFSSTASAIACNNWGVSELPTNLTMASKFTLIGNSGSVSELRLFSDKHFSLAWGSGIDQWNIAGANSILGMYADRGPADLLLLYNSDCSEVTSFLEGKSGQYVAACPLVGRLSAVQEDYASPVNWRGYIVEGTAQDISAQITYEFGRDNSLLEIGPSGEQINYAYYIDTEGLISLYCLDGDIPTDYMWLDVETRAVYRMVYQRDSWTDYIYNIAYPSSDGASGTVMSDDQIIATTFSPSLLLSPSGDFFQALYSEVGSAGVDQFVANLLSISEQKNLLQEEIASYEELERLREKQKEEFLAEMAGLAEERRRQEEEAAAQFAREMEAMGYVYDEYFGIWYIPEVPKEPTYTDPNDPDDEDRYEPVDPTELIEPVAPADQAPSSFGQANRDTPNVSGGALTFTSASVEFKCGCSECHTEEDPIVDGFGCIALVDTSIWSVGTEMLIGSVSSFTAIARDAQGRVSGKFVIVYSVDHDWVQMQNDGIYTIRVSVD